MLSELTPSELAAVDQTLAVPIPGIQFQPRLRLLMKRGVFDGKQHFFSAKTGQLPTGLFPKILNLLPGVQIVDKSLEGYEQTWEAAKAAVESIRLQGVELTDHQKAAAKSAIWNRRGIVKMATNSGKTNLSAAIAKSIGLQTLILVHRKDLLHQTADVMEARLNLPCGKIGDGKRSDGPLVTVAMMQSVDTTTKSGKKYLERFHVFISDEAHHLCSATQQRIASLVDAPFRYALSGSFPPDRLKLFRIMGATDSTLLYEVTNAECIDTGWSATPNVIIKPVDFGNLYPLDYKAAYNQAIAKNPKYDNFIANEIEHWHNQGKTVLALVDRLGQGASIGRKLGGKNIKYEFLNGSHDGLFRRDKLNDMRSNRLPVVIATSILDEGIDVPSLDVVIMAAGGKSSIRLLQRVGRALRRKSGSNEAFIIDLQHIGSSYLENHSEKRLKIYRSEGFSVKFEEKHDIS